MIGVCSFCGEPIRSRKAKRIQCTVQHLMCLRCYGLPLNVVIERAKCNECRDILSFLLEQAQDKLKA